MAKYPQDYTDSNTCIVALDMQYSDEKTPNLEPLTFQQLYRDPLWKVAEFAIARLPFMVESHDSPEDKRPCVSAANKQAIRDIYSEHESDLKELGTTMEFCLVSESAEIPAPVQSFIDALAAVGVFFPPNYIKPEDKPIIRELFSPEGQDFLNIKLTKNEDKTIGQTSHYELFTQYSLKQIRSGGYRDSYNALHVARRTGIQLRHASGLPELCAN